MKHFKIASAFLILGLFTALPALAQHCPNVEFRLWRADGNHAWYGYGDTLEVTSGEEVHLYIHQASGSGSHYSTSAEIGYPASFGMRDDSRRVRQHLRMSAQKDKDKRDGRVIINAEQAGNTRLGYRITGVKSPGQLGRFARQCQTGAINFVVRDRAANKPTRPAPPTSPGYTTPGDAATELVELLYRGLLRRERVRSDPDDFIRQVVQLGKGGLERIAETMTVSPEFRYEALKRTEEAHGSRGGLERLRRQLLDDIYRDLYGYLTPTREHREGDMIDLDRCLSSDRNAEQACSRLGRNLIDSDLFYEQHRELIDSLPSTRRNRR